MKNTNKLLYGIGICDISSIVCNRKRDISYVYWTNMFKRCYSNSALLKRPTYIGCSVSDEWKYYSKFKTWFYKNYIETYHLDKDILIDGNKIYSPETCCFIPHYLNSLFVDCGKTRGQYKIGVCYNKSLNKYQSNITLYTKNVHLGLFDNEIDAHNTWLKAKREYARKLAINAYMNNEIDERIMNAIIIKAYNLK